jgi:hypothetical protein
MVILLKSGLIFLKIKYIILLEKQNNTFLIHSS